MKYKLTENFKINAFGVKLFQIECVTEIRSRGIKVGSLGGWIESEKNLAQEGSAWVFGNAQVFDYAWVYGDAQVSGNAWVSGNADKEKKSLKDFSKKELLNELLSREDS